MNFIYILWFTLEVTFAIYLKKNISFEYPQKVIKLEEFNDRIEKGEQLVILKDLIIDVSEYKFSHPGGKFVLD